MIIKKDCFVHIEDEALKQNVCEWLKSKNIHVCICITFEGWNTLNCSNIERNGILQVEIHGVPNYDKETGYNFEQFKKESQNKIDFKNNIEEFKTYIENNLID